MAVSRVGVIRQAESPYESIELLFDLYGKIREFAGDYEPQNPPIIVGRIKPEEVSARLKTERETKKKRLEGTIANLINMPEAAGLPRVPITGKSAGVQDAEAGRGLSCNKGKNH